MKPRAGEPALGITNPTKLNGLMKLLAWTASLFVIWGAGSGAATSAYRRVIRPMARGTTTLLGLMFTAA